MLGSINTQLPDLRSLTLSSKHSWAGADAVWMQLGQATHLTKLCIGFDKALSVGAFLKDLAPLSNLNGLQCLTYRLGTMAAHVRDSDASAAQFLSNLSNLTALTSLNGDIVVKAGMLEHISSCTALKSLHLTPPRGW